MSKLVIAQLWNVRSDAPYKSAPIGMWLVREDEVENLLRKVQKCEGLEDTIRVDQDGVEFDPWGHDEELVLAVSSVEEGVLLNNDGYNDYPELFRSMY